MRAILVLLALSTPAAFAQQWTDLLPAPDLKGWSRVPIPAVSGVNPKIQWTVDPAAKTLTCKGDGGHEWLRSDKEYSDYILEVDWKFTPKDGETKYNSGIGVRLSKQGELWTQAQTGLAGGWLFGQNIVDGIIKGFNLRAEMKGNPVKPAGEWNHYVIKAVGGTISLEINGTLVSQVSDIGLRKGFIGLEAEGFEIVFRNLRIQELSAKP